MSESTAPHRTPVPYQNGTAQSQRLTDEQIEAVLTDFRHWLRQLAHAPAAPQSTPRLDLATVLGQFTALRHEVNLQTRSNRTAIEQNGQLLESLQKSQTPSGADSDARIKPLLKSLIGVHDALSVAQRQVQRTIDTWQESERNSSPEPDESPASKGVEPTAEAGPASKAKPPGFWARLWGKKPSPSASVKPEPISEDAGDSDSTPVDAWDETPNPLQQKLAAIGDGYELSLRRIERIFPEYGLTPIPAIGETFDPEKMEAIELADEGEVSGTVLEELRRGYCLQGKVFRFAQVKVNR